MKLFTHIFWIIVAVAFFSGCSDSFQLAGPGGNIGISAPSISVQPTKSMESAEYSFDYQSKQAADIDVEVSCSVAPMSDYDGTKATEHTTGNLTEFYMDAYLGDEIETCRGASAADLADRHFMKNQKAQKSGSNWAFVNDQKWRSCVTHYFWGHTGDLTGFTVSGSAFDKAEFSYNNGGQEDVILANHVQYYDDVLAVNRNDDKIGKLIFKHALSQVVVTTDNIVMKQYDINGSKETPTWDRCTIEKQCIISYTTGDCSVNTQSGWDLSWSNLNRETMTEFTSENLFVIPQPTPDLVSMLYVRDAGRLLTLPLFFKLSSAMVPGAPTSLSAGSKYTYKLKGEVIAPYWDGVYGIHANFTGKDFASFCVLKDLASQYVKKVKVTWTGMAESNSAGTYVWMGCEIGSNTPIVTGYPTTDSGLSAKPLIGFAAKYATGNGTPTILKGEVIDGTGLKKDWKLSAEFDLSDIPADKPVSFYMVYDGGNNSGQANWSLKDLSIEVTEFKTSF